MHCLEDIGFKMYSKYNQEMKYIIHKICNNICKIFDFKEFEQ